MNVASGPAIDPTRYTPHELHRMERAWAETNCYADVWIEMLHALGLEPVAWLGTVTAVDFDGDQWTFFKPSHADLYALYGIDVQELNVWRSLPENAAEQLRLGRLVLAEADAFHLPDTSGTDYRTQHVKTTIGIHALDVEQQVLGYFHNGGYYQLRGEDFVNLFRIGYAADPTFMPFFAELVRLDRLVRRPAADLARVALELLAKHMARRPERNPVTAFKTRFAPDVAWLKTEGLARYHAYAFATLRQLGAAFELGAHHLRWLESHGQGGLAAAAAEFSAISETTKVLLLKTARAVASPRPVDLQPLLSELEGQWARGMAHLEQRLR